MSLSRFSSATTYTWAKNTAGAGTYSWSTATNWSPAAVPTTGDDVVFNAPSAAQTITFPTGTLTLNSLRVAGVSGKLYTLDMTGCSFVLSGTALRFSFVNVPVSSGISITATDNVLIENSILGSSSSTFTADFITNNTSKIGGVTANSSASNIYTYQALQLVNSTFHCTMTLQSKSFLIYNNTFNKPFSFTKKNFSSSTPVNSSTGNSNNTFNDTMTFLMDDNIATTNVNWGSNDTYNGVTTISNNTTNLFFINSIGTTNFNHHTYFNCLNTGTSSINIGNAPYSITNFSKGTGFSGDSVNVFFVNNGTGTLVIGNSGGVNFDHSKILLGNTNATGQIRFSSSAASNALPIVVNANCSINAFPDASSAGSGNPYFSAGRLYIDNMDLKAASSGTSFNLAAGSAIEIRERCIFSRSMMMRGSNYVAVSGIFNDNATFINLPGAPATAHTTFRWLTCYKNVSFINQSSNQWAMFGNNAGPTINDVLVSFNTLPSASRSIVLFDNQAAGNLVLGIYTATVSFNNVDVVLRRNPTSFTSIPGNISLAGNALIVFDADSRILIDQTAGAGTSQNIGINMGSTTQQYINCSGTIIACGTDSSPNACGETFSSATPITSGLKNSFIYFNRFVAKTNFQLISSPAADNSTSIIFGPATTFEYNCYIKCQNFAGYGGSFNTKNGVSVTGGPNNGTTTLYMHGNGYGSRVFTGTYTFDGNTTIVNESLNGNTYFLGLNTNDKFYFNSDLLIKNITIGAAPVPATKLSRGGANTYLKGDLRYEGEFGSVPFGNGGAGTCYFNGSGFLGKSNSETQTISCNSTNSTMAFTKLEVNKSTGKLVLANNVKIIVYSGVTGILTLRKGNVLANPTGASTPVGMFILSDNATVSGGGAHSFVEGPMNKQGDDYFKFPIGKANRYFPLSITTPSNASGSFTAEFFSQNIPVASTLTSPLKDLVKCQYWKIDKTGTATSKVQLSWNNASGQDCTPIDANVVTVARFNTSSWVNEGTASLISSPGDSGSVYTANLITDFSYFTFGATLANTINPNDSYAVLKKKTDGSYYSVTDGKLYFKFEEEYSSTSTLNYQVYDEHHTLVSSPSNTVHYGDNRYSWSTAGLTSGKYYTMEVTNSKKEKWVLRFKV